MAILQSLFALISRSAGKILNAIFGWAVRALFGRTSGKENTFLSALVAAAAVWPLLVVGLFVPKLAALLLGFIPIPDSVPDWPVRLVWAGLVLLVPCAIGLTVALKAPPHLPKQSFVRRLLLGFPVTLGLAITFILMFVMVPLVRLAAIARRLKTADVPLVTETKTYHETAALCFSTLNAHGFGLKPARPGWWARAPLGVLRFFSGRSFAAYVPDRVEHFETDGLAVTFYPSGALLRGKGAKLTWAQGLVNEATAMSPALQTSAAPAQQLETQIKRVWRVFLDEPEAHAHSAALLGRAKEITGELATAEITFDDWQVLYRQLLQLQRALHGNPQLYEEQLGKSDEDGGNGKSAADARITHEAKMARAKPMRAVHQVHQEVIMESDNQRKPELRIPPPPGEPKRPVPPLAPTPTSEVAAAPAGAVQDLSTVELVKQITAEVTLLASKQIELAKTELKEDLKTEAIAIGGLFVAALAGICTINLLLVTAVFALATTMPGWTAGLLVSGITLAATASIAWLAWSKRVRKPMARTKRTLKDGVQWTKERLA